MYPKCTRSKWQMASIKIASLTGDTALKIKKAIDDTGILTYEDNSTRSHNILDVYIEIEDWRKELIEDWSPQNSNQNCILDDGRLGDYFSYRGVPNQTYAQNVLLNSIIPRTSRR
jgi:hypothetical protein